MIGMETLALIGPVATLVVLFYGWFLTVDTMTTKWLDRRAARKAASC